MMTGKKQIRPQVTITRQVHPVYADHLHRLEAIGFDLERIITIASNAVWTVGSTVPPKAGDRTDLWTRGNYAQAVQLVASAEFCREPWERVYPIVTAAAPTPEAVERIRAAVAQAASG